MSAMSKPQWDSPHAGNIDSRARLAPDRQVALGDPTMLGGHQEIAATAVGLFESKQIIRVQCKDPYGRQWSFAGNLIVEPLLWTSTNDEWRAFLEVTQGTGQFTQSQLFDLRALVNLASPWYGTPLVGGRISKPWFIDGGVIGASVNARVITVLADPPLAGSETFIGVDVSVASIMAGSGL
jgi:hypothetical protein